MKVIFLQYNLDTYGGIETVNAALTKKMVEDGLDVSLFCLWNTGAHENIGLDEKVKKVVISNKYDRPSYKLMIKNISKLKLSKFFLDVKKFFQYEIHNITDYKNLKRRLKLEEFDYIVVSNYQLIKCIPKDKLNKVLMHMHTGITFYEENKKLLNELLPYNDKIYKFIWLTENSKMVAQNLGFTNSICINNPVKFLTGNKSKLDNNKIVYIGRLSSEKRVDRLINIFNLASKENKKISLEIYAVGYLEKDIKKQISDLNNPRIKYCGGTDNSKEVLLNSSLLALTSVYEGLSMVCLEAYECGVPVIAFDFGPSTSETIIDKNTGYVIEKENDEQYKNKLLEYFNLNEKNKKEFSNNTKKFVKRFEVDNIIEEWYKILK